MPVFRRHLPHIHAIGEPIFLTWRLHGTLPTGRHFPETFTAGKVFATMDKLLDGAQTGPSYLRRPEIADTIVNAIRHLDGRSYHLHTFVVMPNHVHLLMTPRVAVSKITHSLKRFTAKEANKILGLTGKPFWQIEIYDRLVRDHAEFLRIASYIEMNPVKAGLALEPGDYPWSSARPIENRPQVGNLPYKGTTTP